MAAQSQSNRQGRGDVIEGDQAKQVLDLLKDDAERTYKNYEEMLNEDLTAQLLMRIKKD